ncbi:hypothetical protein E2C01_027607 [Portunus trituberculatus]|uniref:Uncharacterized protein n=1 Tax=Portunus trituberculatus TaxID=210409 RepID=A0A5B7EP58_PORTR|nr:hypothetical protein [Portunus trituberculatus]
MDCGVEFREADVVHPFDDVMAHTQILFSSYPKYKHGVTINVLWCVLVTAMLCHHHALLQEHCLTAGLVF